MAKAKAEKEARERAQSVVSLRDIQRFFTLFQFFRELPKVVAKIVAKIVASISAKILAKIFKTWQRSWRDVRIWSAATKRLTADCKTASSNQRSNRLIGCSADSGQKTVKK